MGNELSQLLKELILRVNVMGTDRHWDISQLENPLCPRFGRKDFCGLWVSGKKRNTQMDRKLKLLLRHLAGYDIRLFPLNQFFDLVKS